MVSAFSIPHDEVGDMPNQAESAVIMSSCHHDRSDKDTLICSTSHTFYPQLST